MAIWGKLIIPKKTQLAVAMNNVALLPPAGFRDRKESVCSVFTALSVRCALCKLVTQ